VQRIAPAIGSDVTRAMCARRRFTWNWGGSKIAFDLVRKDQRQ
jgi:hypothetical protein